MVQPVEQLLNQFNQIIDTSQDHITSKL
jgi:hypothetical protein